MVDVKHSRNTKRVQVTFTGEQWGVVQKFKGVMGQSDSEVVRNIVLAWLSEKSLISLRAKEGAEGAGR